MRANDILKRFDELAVQWIPKIMGQKLDGLVAQVSQSIGGDLERAKAMALDVGAKHPETGAFIRSSPAAQLLKTSGSEDSGWVSAQMADSGCAEVLGFMIALIKSCGGEELSAKLNHALVSHADRINSRGLSYSELIPKNIMARVQDFLRDIDWDPETAAWATQVLVRNSVLADSMAVFMHRMDKDGTLAVPMDNGEEDYKTTKKTIMRFVREVIKRTDGGPVFIAGAAAAVLELASLKDEASALNTEFLSVIPTIRRG